MYTTIALSILTILAVLWAYLNRSNRQSRLQAMRTAERMETIMQTSLDAIIVSDICGVIQDFNPAAEKIFGYSADEAIGQTMTDLIIPEKFKAAHQAGMERMRQKGEKRVVGKGRVRLEATRKDGEIFPVELAIQSAFSNQEEIFIAFLRDISQQVAADEELIKARDDALASDKAKTNFLATVSHEIRTPLNGLLGNLTLLNATKLNVKQTNYVKNMEISGRLLMSHISDVLDIISFDAGNLEAQIEPIHLSSLLEDIISSQSGLATAQGTMLEWGWDGDAAQWMQTDPRKLQHILVNLIGNAIKFTQDGRISVMAKQNLKQGKLHEIEISVTDTGIGIDPEIKLTIFDDFFTGDASYKRDVGGTGLGLGIVKRFVTALGGQIRVDSIIGQGSRFTVTFPTTAISAPQLNTTKDTQELPNKTLKVLLVEDNEINRFVTTEILTNAGHDVTEAVNGQLGVQEAAENSYDLILMDISMPVMDGREATRAIRAAKTGSYDAPIIALTANAMPQEQEAFFADGMNDVLTKPLTPGNLVKVINKWTPEHSAKPAKVSQRHLDEMRDLIGPEQHQALIKRFMSEGDDFFTLIDAQNDTDTIASAAHKLAGSAATLGAEDFAIDLRDMENTASAGDLTATKNMISGMKRTWEQTQTAFNSHM